MNTTNQSKRVCKRIVSQFIHDVLRIVTCSSEDECLGISFYGSVEPHVHAIYIYIYVIFTYNAD